MLKLLLDVLLYGVLEARQLPCACLVNAVLPVSGHAPVRAREAQAVVGVHADQTDLAERNAHRTAARALFPHVLAPRPVLAGRACHAAVQEGVHICSGAPAELADDAGVADGLQAARRPGAPAPSAPAILRPIRHHAGGGKRREGPQVPAQCPRTHPGDQDKNSLPHPSAWVPASAAGDKQDAPPGTVYSDEEGHRHGHTSQVARGTNQTRELLVSASGAWPQSCRSQAPQTCAPSSPAHLGPQCVVILEGRVKVKMTRECGWREGGSGVGHKRVRLGGDSKRRRECQKRRAIQTTQRQL